MPSAARWRALREQALAALQALCDEMQGYADECLEAWQESDRGEQFAASVTAMEEARDAVDAIPLE